MYKVGLTGNYFSGQNEVAKIFEDYNVRVFDANLITKFLINYSPIHIPKIKKEFGPDIYSVGLLDLSKLNDNKSFNKLLDIIELDLLRAYEIFRKRYKNDFYTIFYFDYIFERNLDKILNFNITSFRPKHYRKSNMEYFTSFPENIIKKILDNEMDHSIKNKKSDYVIQNYNKGTDPLSDIVIGLENQVKLVHKRIMSKKINESISRQFSDTIDWY